MENQSIHEPTFASLGWRLPHQLAESTSGSPGERLYGNRATDVPNHALKQAAPVQEKPEEPEDLIAPEILWI